MDREQLEQFAKSPFATQRITTQDVRDILMMLDAAEGRMQTWRMKAVDHLLDETHALKAQVNARAVHALATELLDKVEELSGALDSRMPMR